MIFIIIHNVTTTISMQQFRLNELRLELRQRMYIYFKIYRIQNISSINACHNCCNINQKQNVQKK